ncbi:tripartite tricarboxylate transporter TctB family protein [Propylenella binzhouense]|nr:tripartite tricarboxylate transporter TctB family protein [Propylenella binzhouense]
MALRHEDTVGGGALIAVGGVVTLLSLDMGTGAAGATLPPNFFPLLCSAGLMICGAVLLVRGLLSAAKPLPALLDARVGAVLVALVAYFWWFEAIDFRVGTWLFALVALFAFGLRRPRQLIFVPIVLSAALYLAFTYGFDVVLPSWT